MIEETASPEQATSERVGLRTLRERRWRVYRGVFMLVLSTAIVVALTVLNRDEAAIRACDARMRFACDAFQAMRDSKAPVPASLLELRPDPSRPVDREDHATNDLLTQLWTEAYYNALFDLRCDSGREVGVCCCQAPHARLIGASGRYVVVYDPVRRRFAQRWLDEDAFQRQADQLGLSGACEP
jgi:hypothetical protein